MLPAHERFGLLDAAGAEHHLRLIDDVEVVLLERDGELPHQLELA